MALVNRLIREARNGATVLEINPNQVGTIVEHCLACSPGRPTLKRREEVMDAIRAGELLLLGVPVRVRGMEKPPGGG